MEKRYSNGEVTIVWKPDLCIHSGNCVRGLPSVFDPKARPWINVQGAESADLIDQVAKCPSGALTIDQSSTSQQLTMEQQCTVLKDGPVKIKGPVSITHADGREETIERDVFLCRCGSSSNKPFCDGSHRGAGFAD